MFIDAHCHFNNGAIKIEELSNSLKNFIFIDSSIDYNTSKISIDLSNRYDFIFSSIGFSPFFIKESSSDLIDKYSVFLVQPKVIAIGEVGLDYKLEDFKTQEIVFRKFIELAILRGLPLVIHSRFDFDIILNILDEYFNSYENIMFHCFSHSAEMLKRILKKNAFISFSLNVLRKNNNIIDSLANCPLENLLLETDFPYMKINNRNSIPTDIEILYSFVSSIKNIEKNKLEEIIYLNIKRIFFKDEKKSSYLKDR